jgi:hypothetical protein
VTVHLYISKLYENRQSTDFSVAILTIKITFLVIKFKKNVGIKKKYNNNDNSVSVEMH